MTHKIIFTILLLLVFLTPEAQIFEARDIHMYWHDSLGRPFLTFKRLRQHKPSLRFITNVGSSDRKHHPTGLYIENGAVISPIKTIQNQKVYHGIQPDGVFVIFNNRAEIITVRQGMKFKGALYASQAAPMLVINNRLNPALPKGKTVRRNGVGILADGRVYFACKTMGYRDFARHFLEMGCTSALQLDYGSSQCWDKDSATEEYGRFGIMIAVE